MIDIKDYIKANTIKEAIEFARTHKGAKYVGGGTDLMVNKIQGNDASEVLIDLSGIQELSQIKVEKDQMWVGSLVALETISESEKVRSACSALAEAAHSVASPLLRKSATIGGNLLCENRCSFYNQTEWWREAVGYCLKCDGDLCIATGGTKACFSRFVSDTAPVLIALNASVEIQGPSGQRIVPVETLYTGDGLNPRTIQTGEMITWVKIPLKPLTRCVFKKLRPREAVDFTSLTTAVAVNDMGDVRISVGGVDPGPIMVIGAKGVSPAELVNRTVKKCRIVDNDIYSRSYRKEMAKLYIEESLKMLGLKV